MYSNTVYIMGGTRWRIFPYSSVTIVSLKGPEEKSIISVNVITRFYFTYDDGGIEKNYLQERGYRLKKYKLNFRSYQKSFNIRSNGLNLRFQL